MRFFSGTRDTSGKKGAASELYRQNMDRKKNGQPELTSDEKYKQMVDARMEKMRVEAMMGTKPGFRLPGTKQDDKPKELSKHAKEMLQILAMRKAKKDLKQEKKKMEAFNRAKKAQKNAEEARKTAEQQKLLLAQRNQENNNGW